MNRQRYQNPNYEDRNYNQNMEQQLASQMKKTAHRRTVDHGNPMGRWFLQKAIGKSQRVGKIRPEATYAIDMLPPLASKRNAAMDTPTKFAHLSANKAKHAIHAVKWTPEGRRLLVASHSGEFTLWNGMTFNFETIMQAHDSAIFSLSYSHNDDWLLSGDQEGTVKFWQPNFNNVNIINAHGDGIRDIAFSPNDSKFLTASDDSTMKIWSFHTGQEERTLAGHHWDVKSADWHANLGLIVSGSKDNLLKLWDPRQAACITTIHGFKHTVTKTRFQKTGTQRLLASVSRDRSTRVFDLRTMKDLLVLRGNESDLSSLAWHPVHSNMLTTATYDGSISHYMLDTTVPEKIVSNPQSSFNGSGSTPEASITPFHEIPYAHEKAVHTLEYHPLGHLLCSAGADRSARFWCRSRPNDPLAFLDATYTNDKVGAWYYGVNNGNNASSAGTASAGQTERADPSASASNNTPLGARNQALPGLPGLPGLSLNANSSTNFMGIPGLGENFQDTTTGEEEVNGNNAGMNNALPGLGGSGLPGLGGSGLPGLR